MTKPQTEFENFLNQKDFIILGGGFGTELQRRGYKTTLPLWSAQANLDAPDLVVEIHRDYFNAGSDICVTNTSSGSSIKVVPVVAGALSSIVGIVICK